MKQSGMEDEIAEHYFERSFDLLMGSGNRYLYPELRSDGQSICQKMYANG